MRPLSLCRIDGVDAYAITVNSLGAVSAEVGFMLEGRRFGMAQLSGLEDHPEVADLAKRLIEAIEGVVAGKMGSADQPLSPRREYLGSGGTDI
jgi:hypothetical protein